MKKGETNFNKLCPFCNYKLELNSLENILLGYNPYFCKVCDMTFNENELKQYNIVKRRLSETE